MRTALVVVVGALTVACGTAPAEAQRSDQANLQVGPASVDPSCKSWACTSSSPQSVSDAQLFTMLRKFEPAGDNPVIVQVAALECTEISGSCQPPSCSIRTTCGGGGPLEGDDASVAIGWLTQRNAPQETARFASRRTATQIACEQQPVTGGVACTFGSLAP